MRTKACALALFVLLVAAAPAAAADCPKQARCAQISVPLDHSGATAGRLPLTYAVLPATGARTGTLVVLTGGPGQSGVAYTDLIRPLLEPARKTHDIVLVDQRGTGGSGSTHCESSEGCPKRLGAKRAFLTTLETARDLEDLRVALGVEKLTLLGVSYGTKVAGEYARRYPERTAALVLDSAVGTDAIDLVGLNAIEAMPRVLRDVCATQPCASTVKDAGAALFNAVKRVRRSPVPGPVVVPGTRLARTRVDDNDVFAMVRSVDEDPALAADLPAALESLARGDAAPLIHLHDRQTSFITSAPDDEPEPDEDTFGSFSRYIATVCLETRLPWSPASKPDTRGDATRAYLAATGTQPFAPFRPRNVLRFSVAGLCEEWPATPVPEAVPAPGPDVPVLILSGGEDLRTPTEDAQRIAATYPRATVFKVPHVGHSVLSQTPGTCVRDAVATFLGGGAPAACEQPPLLAPAPYLPPTTRGVTAAVQVTINGLRHDLDAAKALGARAPRILLGMRSGYATVRRGRLRLRDVEWARGVRVSGTLSAFGNGTLTAKRRTLTVRRFKVDL